MLHVILATALSAYSAVPTDSVRPAAKGSPRPDSSLLALPLPAIRAPEAPKPSISHLVTLAWPSRQSTVSSAPPAAEQVTAVKSETVSAVASVVRSSGDVAQVAAKPAPTSASAAVLAMASLNAAPAGSAPAAAASATTPPASTNAADSTQRAEVVQQASAPKESPLRVAIAAPDASAVVRPAPAVMPPAAAAPEMTADGRIVTSKRTTIITEPLHAVPIPAAGLRVPPPSIADSIVVYKRERTLTLFYRGVPQRSYFVALGSKPVGDKLQAGDKRTPEGLFYIDAHNPASKYHLALHISYPDAAHRAKSQSLGFDPGGDIMIHGLPKEFSGVGKDHRIDDWTNGCVALSNLEIEEIWRAVPDGTPVQIKP